MTDRIFIPPTTYPTEYVTRVGGKAVILAQAPNGRYVGYLLFSDNTILSLDWDSKGRFSPDRKAITIDLFSPPKKKQE